MRLYTSGLTYSEAIALQGDLKKAGIESNITTGALAICLYDSKNKNAEEKSTWLKNVFAVVGNRCSLSGETPILQQLILNQERAMERINNALGDTWTV